LPGRIIEDRPAFRKPISAAQRLLDGMNGVDFVDAADRPPWVRPGFVEVGSLLDLGHWEAEGGRRGS